MRETIGVIAEKVINTLSLSLDANTPILIGDTNREHMQSEHPEDYEKYGDKVADILANPDYVAKHPRKPSIEYIKVFYDKDKEDYVLVAVRATTTGTVFARTLFVMSDEKVKKYKEKDALKKV